MYSLDVEMVPCFIALELARQKGSSEGNKKAAAKAKRSYRPRLCGKQVVPPAVLAKTAQRQAAMRARGGSCYSRPVCTYPRFVPLDANTKTVYSCAMPRVRLPGGDWYKCDFTTSANSWRLRRHS